jgi:hypothetical protein
LRGSKPETRFELEMIELQEKGETHETGSVRSNVLHQEKPWEKGKTGNRNCRLKEVNSITGSKKPLIICTQRPIFRAIFRGLLIKSRLKKRCFCIIISNSI